MASFYSVVRLVPDSVANEAINIGVIVASGERIAVRALNEWERVRHFAGSGTSREVKRIIEDLQADPRAFLGVDRIDSADDFRAALSQWTRSIQFSDVHASLDEPDVLLNSIEPMVLPGQRGDMVQQSRRDVVVRTVHRAMISAFELRFARRPRGLVKRSARVAGRRTSHKIDVGVANGILYAGAFGLSFATPQIDRQWKDTDAVAFAIEDVMRTDVVLGVVTDTPTDANEAATRAHNLFRGMNVPVIPVEHVDEWARGTINALPDALVGPHT